MKARVIGAADVGRAFAAGANARESWLGQLTPRPAGNELKTKGCGGGDSSQFAEAAPRDFLGSGFFLHAISFFLEMRFVEDCVTGPRMLRGETICFLFDKGRCIRHQLLDSTLPFVRGEDPMRLRVFGGVASRTRTAACPSKSEMHGFSNLRVISVRIGSRSFFAS
ncbi:MAG: hypothetical protein O2960_19805 [Verrucomicrobia bacterium]|nr:hypothetical protein [Verrucomicrobiota bacterium]